MKTWFRTRLAAPAEVYDVVMGVFLATALIEDYSIGAVIITFLWALTPRDRNTKDRP